MDYTITIHIIACCFLGSLIIQLIYYWGIFSRVSFYSASNKKSEFKSEPVSVIICAKNEEDNLGKNLPFILEQDYPDYEVIVINDGSTDHSDEVLGKLKKKYNHLKIRMLEESKIFFDGKKLGLTIGIKAAKNEWLLFTDADCKPESNQWIKSMQDHFVNGKEIVIGYGGFIPEFSLLNNIFRFDNFFIAIQYLGFALAGIPYMGVGRNLAYRKSMFFRNKGFASHLHVASGDDDLFVQETANKKNSHVAISPDAYTRSTTPSSLNKWIKQKKRHIGTSKYYKFSIKILLGSEMFSRLVFYSSFVFLLIHQLFFYYIFYLFFIRTITQLIIFKLATNKLKEKHFLLVSIIYDILLPFFYFIIFISNLVVPNKNKWQ